MPQFLSTLVGIKKVVDISSYLETQFHMPVNPNLGGGGIILPPCWYSFNDSETVKAITLAFWNIQ